MIIDFDNVRDVCASMHAEGLVGYQSLLPHRIDTMLLS